jgi:pseudouridine-5'-phosphate glycosidase
VALESSIIAQGMPYPHNISTALEVEKAVRAFGAEPATIALIKGEVRVGLNDDEIQWLGDPKTESVKVSRRDFGWTLAAGKTGATTVAATMIAARMAGIDVFATGGIGGVHRGVESTMDISADLTEMGRTPVIVVTAGAKAILDLPRTMEFMETQGVLVAGWRTSHFPAFYSRESGLRVETRFEEASEVACAWRSHRLCGLESAMILANPIPEADEIPASAIEQAIAEALREMERAGVTGKRVTPFLLGAVSRLTHGKSLAANVALVVNNARVAASVAQEISRLGRVE